MGWRRSGWRSAAGAPPAPTLSAPGGRCRRLRRAEAGHSGGMKLFADAPVHRTRQVVGDLLLVGWMVLWVWAGLAVHDGTAALAAPARQTDESASSMAEQLRDAGGRIGDAPLVGDELAVPFDKAADA